MVGLAIVGHGTTELQRSLEAVVGRVLAGGVPAPSWIALAGADGEWLDHARRADGSQRARAVVVTSDADDLVRAVRLGFGGAATTPPSTPALDAALRAAASGSAPPPIDSAVVDEVLADPAGAWRVGWSRRPLWPRVLGAVRTARALVHLADVLGVPPILTTGPELLIAGAQEPPVASAWREIAAGGREVPGEVPEVSRAATSYRQQPPPSAAVKPRPVYELPSGRRLGGWWVSPAVDPAGGWVAVPGRRSGDPWRLQAASSIEEIPQVVSPAAVAAAGCPVVRVPSWATVDLRAGSPSALLVEQLAVAARRSTTRLWIPGVDGDGLHVLLRLGHPTWVDGPAVPE